MAESTTILRVNELVKRYETAGGALSVIDGVSFELAGGDSLAVVGPSGSGKSTLLHVIGTLDRPSSGSVTLGGQDPYALDEPALARFRNRHVGFVFQDAYLLPQYSVLENVLVPTMAQPGSSDGAEARARELLERVGLGHRLNHRPAELSGGERQRTAVARALVLRPGLLLCDEPTGSLDARSAGAVADLLFELHAEAGTILIAVTHSLELAGRFPRRFELREGRCSEP